MSEKSQKPSQILKCRQLAYMTQRYLVSNDINQRKAADGTIIRLSELLMNNFQ